MSQDRRPIAVFDSGIGGLSVLRALHAALPHEDFIYYADTAHAPYGERDELFVMERSLVIARDLLDQRQAKALIVACNTATAAAVDVLRHHYPSTIIVGIEPALKPAAAATRTGCVGVFATRGTLQSTRFAALLAKFDGPTRFICQPCDGLAEAIEQTAASADATKVIALCDHYTRTLGVFGHETGEIDTLVLGCTHYVFAAQHLQAMVGAGVLLLEPGAAVARHASQLLQGRGLLSPASSQGQTALLASGQSDALHRAAAHWLQD